MGFTGEMEKFNRKVMDVTREIDQIHERYATALLQKHFPGISTDDAKDQLINRVLEEKGYFVEHRVHPKIGGEKHVWRLWKLVDSSPEYRIKRVVSVETEEKEPSDHA